MSFGLGDSASVGTLFYQFLDPPIMIGVDNLQQTCDIGNTTTTDIVCAKVAAGTPHTPTAELSILGTTAPTLRIVDLPFNSQAELTAFDTNVALSSVNNHPLNFKTNGVQRIAIDTTGLTTFTNAGATDFLQVNGITEQLRFIGKDVQVSKSDEVNNISIGWKVDTATNSKVIAIGNNILNSGADSINIGSDIATGVIQQGSECISIGRGAGGARQQQGCIAIGTGAGAARQQTNSIAIGYECCPDTQGSDSIAIGTIGVNLPSGSVAINAGGVVLTPTTTGCFINPIAGGTNPAGGIANTLWYNTITKEVQYHIP
jgi:hypothetical protein